MTTDNENTLPSVEEITEKASKIYQFEPEEVTERVKEQNKPQPRPVEIKEIELHDGIEHLDKNQKLKNGFPDENSFAKSNTYESLLSEIMPDPKYDTNDFVFDPRPREQEKGDEFSVTEADKIATIQKQKKKGLLERIYLTLGMIKFQHSIFALPFALISVFVASNGNPGVFNFLLIVLAMITARNSAMTFNRIVDRHMDKKNPRTRDREIPSGQLSLKFAMIFGVTNIILFVIVSLYFNMLTFLLSPLALLIILGYSLTKRFTHYTQFYLGLALGCSPIAAWIAMTGSLAWFPVILGLAVMFWVAGFDFIYSTLDYNFDQEHKVKNLVVKFGVTRSLTISGVVHIFAVLFFVLAGFINGMHLFYYLGCLLTAVLLVYEHRTVKPQDLSRVNMAFFTLNGYVSLFFFAFVLLDIYVIGM